MNKQNLIDTKNNMVVSRGKGGLGVAKGKGSQIYSDKRFDFGWSTRNAIYV